MYLPTVKIWDGNRDDYIIINECDFNPEIHRVYVDSVADGNGHDVLVDGDGVNDEG